MRKILLLAVFFTMMLATRPLHAAQTEDGAEICTPKKGCKMLLNILPTPISSVKAKKQCRVTWAVRPDLFSVVEPLPKSGCKTYMRQNLGRWWREHRGTGPAPWPPKVFLEPIPVKYNVWR